MLYIGQPNHVTFKVTIAGSSAEPEARVFVGDQPALCFPAERDAEGVFHADVWLPATTVAGDTAFRVEVLLNSRVFVPIKKMVPVLDVQVQPEVFAAVETVETPPVVELPAVVKLPPEVVVPEAAPEVPATPPKPTCKLDASIFRLTTKAVEKQEPFVLPPVSLNLEHLKAVKPSRLRAKKAPLLEGAPGSNITITKGKVVLV